MLSRWLCWAMPITTWPIRLLSTWVFASVPVMEKPPSWVVL
jgi:hypothetical protein